MTGLNGIVTESCCAVAQQEDWQLDQAKNVILVRCPCFFGHKTVTSEYAVGMLNVAGLMFYCL